MQLSVVCPRCKAKRSVARSQLSVGVKCSRCDAYMDVSRGGVAASHSSNNAAPSESAEYGLLHRSHGCIVSHRWLGWVIGVGFIAAGPLGLVLFPADRPFHIGLTIVGFLLGALILYATVRTGRLRLDLFDRGMVFQKPGGGTWQCAYRDVAKLFVIRGTFERIKFVLKDGSIVEATGVSDIEAAANFVLTRI